MSTVKLAISLSHVIFNVTCLQHEIPPQSLILFERHSQAVAVKYHIPESQEVGHL